jgi:uncharacterized protein YrrD
MKFIDGAEVFTAKNEKVGHIDRVVLEPRSKEVTHLVVRKGFLLKEDKVVPLAAVDHVIDEKVILEENIEDLTEFPPFAETEYIRADESERLEEIEESSIQFARPVYWYPVYGYGGLSQVHAPPIPLYYSATQRNIPEGTIPLKEGAKVISLEGETAGKIKEVRVDPEQECATHIVVEEGLFFPDRKILPTIWLTNVLEDEVHLAMTSSTLERLPEYEG